MNATAMNATTRTPAGIAAATIAADLAEPSARPFGAPSPFEEALLATGRTDAADDDRLPLEARIAIILGLVAASWGLVILLAMAVERLVG